MLRICRAKAIVLLFLSVSVGQSLRFRDEVFSNLEVTPDVAYGSAVNPSSGQLQTLLLDRYQPLGDLMMERPAIVVVHGGGFVAGNKGDANVVAIAERFARCGYVAVSINYRLLSPRSLPTLNTGGIRDLQGDVKAAVRYLRSVALPWRIDPDRIAVIGGSAGAMLGLAAAYMESEGQSGNPGFSSEIQAIISLWGQSDPAEIDAGESPVCIIHGTSDPLVPYSAGLAVYNQAQALGIPSELHPLQGVGHSPYPLFQSDYFDDALAFCWENLDLGQLAGLAVAPGFSAPGTLVVQASGVAGDQRFFGVALGFAALPVPGIGELCLDPLSLFLLPMTTFPATPRLPTLETSFVVPASAHGLSFWIQELHLDPAGAPRQLTNCIQISF